MMVLMLTLFALFDCRVVLQKVMESLSTIVLTEIPEVAIKSAAPALWTMSVCVHISVRIVSLKGQ